MPKFCAVAICKNTTLDKSLSWHRFPKSDVKVRNSWIQRCRRPEPINITNSRVCSAHFAPDDFQKNLREDLMGTPGRRYLKPNAIPTLNLDSDEHLEQPHVPQTRKRKRPSTTDGLQAGRITKVIATSKRLRKLDEESYMSEEIFFEVDEPTDSQHDNSNDDQSMIKQARLRGPEKGVFECSTDLIGDDEDDIVFKNDTEFKNESSQQHDTSDCTKIVVNRDEQPYHASKISSGCGKILDQESPSNLSPSTKPEENYNHDVAKHDPSSTEYEASLETKCNIEYQHERLFHQANPAPYKTEVTPEKLSHFPKLTRKIEEIFTPNQLKSLMKTNKRIHWTDDEIFEAIKLRFSCLPMYTYLRNEKGYPFPGRLAISRWAKKMKLRGVLHSLLKIMELERKSSTKAKNHEMNNLCVLSLGEMEVKETVEYDEIHDEIIGPFKRMQVMMASSLTGSWRQPVFVDFNSNITKDTVINMIVELFSIGYNVVCFSSDCSDASVKLWNDLGACVDSPCFPHPIKDRRIVVIPDALHAIRLLRDNLLDCGFEIEGSSISRKPLDSLLDLGVCSRLRPYLLQLVNREKRRTDLAVQLISNTVGTALTQHKPGNADAATSTGNFLKVMNHWFDLMNVGTSELTVPFRSPYGHKRREQDKLLNHVKSVMSNMKCGENGALKCFQIGIIMSCNGLSMLLDETNKHFKVEYIESQWLNHTSIDSLFSLLSCEFSEVPSPIIAVNRLQSNLFGDNLNSTSEKHCVFTYVARRARIKLDVSKPGHLSAYESITLGLLDIIFSSPKYITDNDLSHQCLNLIALKINSALGHKYPQLCKFPGHDQRLTPTAYFFGNLVKMEKVFVVFTRGLIAAECRNIVSHLTRLMKRFSNSLPVEVIEIFVRLRTEIYARSLVPKLSQLVIKRMMHSKLLMALKENEQ